MTEPIYLSSLDDARLDCFTRLTDVQLRSVKEQESGIYLAESEKVIARAIAAGHRVLSVLTPESALGAVRELLARRAGETETAESLSIPRDESCEAAEAEPLQAPLPEPDLFVGTPEQLAQITGFQLHRGPIAAVARPKPTPPARILKASSRVVVLDGLVDHTNVGAAFRAAAALGADAVLLSDDCADPLYRRAVRVSMGAVFQLPWARLPDWRVAGPLLRQHGFTQIGFALREGCVEFSRFLADPLPARTAFLFGSEGHGLSRKAQGAADTLVKISMAHGIDSLNVASSIAVALWGVRHAAAGAAADHEKGY